jgi:hypothetical protein
MACTHHFAISWRPVFCPCLSALVGPNHHSAKKVLILTMKLRKMKKSSNFDHEIMNLFEKNVGTPAILGKTMGDKDKFYFIFNSTS